MTITDAPQGVDNYDWLQAIADHPDLNAEHLCAAYDLLGVETDMDEDLVFWRLYDLETYGFLRAKAIRPRSRLARWLRRSVNVRYTFLLPDKIVSNAELDAMDADERRR